MKNFIENKIGIIFNDFQKDINHLSELCVLDDLSFEGSNIPDYSNSLIQKLYLLRYMPAYLAEYYLIYKDALELCIKSNNLNILSIGCGSCIDLWGLKFAHDEWKKYNAPKEISYTGIDIIDWDYKENLDVNNVEFIIDDINNRIKNLGDVKYNIIIFPKSLGELDDSTFNNILNTLKTSNFIDDEFTIISSNIITDNAKYTERLDKLTKTFSDCNYIPTTELKRNFSCEVGISNIVKKFAYPDDIMEDIKNIKKHCKNCYSKCKYCMIGRNPILKADKIIYQILHFKKK